MKNPGFFASPLLINLSKSAEGVASLYNCLYISMHISHSFSFFVLSIISGLFLLDNCQDIHYISRKIAYEKQCILYNFHYHQLVFSFSFHHYSWIRQRLFGFMCDIQACFSSMLGYNSLPAIKAYILIINAGDEKIPANQASHNILRQSVHSKFDTCDFIVVLLCKPHDWQFALYFNFPFRLVPNNLSQKFIINSPL